MLHSLGVAMAVVGAAAALSTEAVGLWGAARGRRNLSDFYRRPSAMRWFFSGLALLVIGVGFIYH